MSEFDGDLFEPVVIESPYAGDVERNVAYARAAMADCLRRGEAPYASHLLYTQPGVLRDEIPAERVAGIAAGFAWRRVARKTVVYTDLGISGGMRAGIQDAEDVGRPVEYRTIEAWAASPPDPTQACAERLACGVIQRCECEAGHRRFVTWPDPAAPGPHVHAWPRGGSRFEPDAVCIGPDCLRAEHNR